MITVTLNLTLPDELAERLAALPPDEVNAFAVSALTELVSDADAALDAETATAIEQGMADVEAGRTFSPEEVRARTDAALDALAAARLQVTGEEARRILADP
jgi:predicted transcriptional regulator